MSRRLNDYSSKRSRGDDYYIEAKRNSNYYDRKDNNEYYPYESSSSSSKRPRTDYNYFSNKTNTYRTLYLPNLNYQISENSIEDGLNKVFRKFGDFNMKIISEEDGNRFAYLTFKYPEDARKARHDRQGVDFFNRRLQIESYCERNATETQEKDTSDNLQTQSRRSYSPNEKRFSRSGSIRSGITRDGKYAGHHLPHIPPENDDKATRTLFIGNLSSEVNEDYLRKMFAKYGNVTDVDVKRSPHGQGNAYAFVKFENLDMAHEAKLEMSGQQIGQFQCKIGYGKPNPSNCLWIGNLGPSVREDQLEKEFDRFGVINKIHWPRNKSYAYILFENYDAAQAAKSEMRGSIMGGKDYRLRIDFADSNIFDNGTAVDKVSTSDNINNDNNSVDSLKEKDTIVTVDQLADSTKQVWAGTLSLKNSTFPSRMHLIHGNVNVIKNLLANNEPLKITQRLRLDESKVADVKKKLETVGDDRGAVLLAVPDLELESTTCLNNDGLTRQLSTLITYLRNKKAAGVVPLQGGMIHAFPPCQFASEFLRTNKLKDNNEQEDDYMIVIIVQN